MIWNSSDLVIFNCRSKHYLIKRHFKIFDVFWIWMLLGRIRFLCQTILCQVFNNLTWGHLQTITVWILGNFSQNLLLISENSLTITLRKQIGSEFFWDSVHRWRGSVRLLLSSMSSFSKAAVTLLESTAVVYCLLLLSPIATAAILSFNTEAKLCSFFYTALFALQLSKGWELLLGLHWLSLSFLIFNVLASMACLLLRAQWL